MIGEEHYLQVYYADNAQRLHQLVDRILRRFGGISQKDYDDFYSIANEVFCDVMKRYDCGQNFEAFLYSCLSNKIKSEITKKNREKRSGENQMVSLDAPLGDHTELTLGEVLDSGFHMEEELDKKSGHFKSEEIELYFQNLSSVQRNILRLRMEGQSKNEIIEKMNLTRKNYEDQFRQMRSYEKIRAIHSDFVEEREETTMRGSDYLTAQTSEISKTDKYSIASLIKKLKNHSVRDDHPLQRNSGQWKSDQKYNLITTILNNYPIPEVILAEQVKPGGTVNWLIDGLQRLTNASDYKNNLFKIGKNAERPVISYQVALMDEGGNMLLDEDGSAQYETRSCDVRGRYYRDLPEELQERFNDYTITVVQYLSCSDEDIEFHIRRYNASSPMSVAQKGITHLGEQYARVVKKLVQHRFFRDKGNYRLSEFTSGTMERVVTESVMTVHFLDDWRKKQEEICKYLKENVKVSQLDHFENMLDRLSEVITDETACMFNSKDSFLWFGLYERFLKAGLADEKFVEFMDAFRLNLHSKPVKGQTFDCLNEKSTKDKSTIVEKLNLMEALMDEFLHIKKEKSSESFIIREKKTETYIHDFLQSDLVKTMDIRKETDQVRVSIQSLMMVCGESDLSDKHIQRFMDEGQEDRLAIEDTLLYLDGLNDWTVGVDNNSAIFDKENLPVLVSVVAFVYRKDMSEEQAIRWFESYVENFRADGCFTKRKTENLNRMIQSLNRYVKYEADRDRGLLS